MLTVIDRYTKLAVDADISQFSECPIGVYNAWINRVRENRTLVSTGDHYLWLYVQLLPPRIVNCVITVKEGDEYPPTVVTG